MLTKFKNEADQQAAEELIQNVTGVAYGGMFAVLAPIFNIKCIYSCSLLGGSDTVRTS